jgi:hypothetical protein
MNLISLLGVNFLAVVALILAIYQQRSASKQTSELKEIRHSLSTQYIGQFPDYISKVVDLVKSAKTEVLIAYGQVTFGMFSYREKWLEYRTTLEQKLNEGKTVDLIFLNEKQRRNHQIEQFGLAQKSWKEKLDDPEFKARMDTFAKHYATTQAEKMDSEMFLSLLELQQKKPLEDSFRTAIKTEASSPFAIHFWIADGSRAVFTMPNFVEGPTEFGFLTSDTRLIQALRSIHTRQKRNAKAS